MELRNTEQEVNDMMLVYESLHRCEITSLPALEIPEAHPSKALLEGATLATYYSTQEEALQALESLKAKFSELDPRTKKFRQRLAEKDPITEAPRYGEKTATRVQNLLVLHGILQAATWGAFGLKLEEDGTEASVVETNSAVANLRSEVESQQHAQRQAELQEQQQAEAVEAEKRAAEERQRLEEQRKLQEAEESRRREETDLARRAQESREATRRAAEEAAQAERDWIASIAKGPEGVRQQIQILKDDTKEDSVAQKTALKSLLTIFSQIAAHPEDVNFRRIRRDHPQFHQDVGRHKGGRELLIAAGFKLTTLDDVPVFFSKEPDLESDMDGWSLWFDNLKSNLEVVKEMQ